MFSESIENILGYECSIHLDNTNYKIDMELGIITDCCCDTCYVEMNQILQNGKQMDNIVTA